MKPEDAKVGMRVITKLGKKRGKIVALNPYVGLSDCRVRFDKGTIGWRLSTSLLPEPADCRAIIEATLDAFAKAPPTLAAA